VYLCGCEYVDVLHQCLLWLIACICVCKVARVGLRLLSRVCRERDTPPPLCERTRSTSSHLWHL
jgi:hypothetical protein